MRDLKEALTFKDAVDIWEVLMVDAYNEKKAYDEAIEEARKRGRR